MIYIAMTLSHRENEKKRREKWKKEISCRLPRMATERHRQNEMKAKKRKHGASKRR